MIGRLSLVLLAIFCAHFTLLLADTTSVSVKVVNHAGEPIELFWINTFEDPHTYVAQTKKPIRNSTDAKINSYDGHQFQIRFLKNPADTEVNFTKGPQDETIIVTFNEEEGRLNYKQISNVDEMFDYLKAETKLCHDNFVKEDLVNCVTNSVMKEIQRLHQTKEVMNKFQLIMSERLRNYSCHDPKLQESTPLRWNIFRFLDRKYNVSYFVESDRLKIWKIDGFITDEECEVLLGESSDQLTQAVISDASGRSVISDNRKALHATHMFLPETLRPDPLWPFFRRVIYTTNFHTGYSILPEGQEGISLIKYSPGDEYKVHCDGACDGTKYLKGGRVATALMYCKVADEGGGTTFSKADVFIKPKRGTAVFFSYKGRDGFVDDGYSAHSGCPVVAGEKVIATAWLREGVSTSKPWFLHNHEGVPQVSQAQSEISEAMKRGDKTFRNEEL